jgi:hypothetical protein
MDASKGGIKLDEGKAHGWIYLPAGALAEVAQVLDYGAQKYSPGNWRGGMPWSRCYNGAMRHLTAWANGETFDPETGFNHVSHAIANLMFLREYAVIFPSGDDRYSVFQGLPSAVLPEEQREDSRQSGCKAKKGQRAGSSVPRPQSRQTSSRKRVSAK